MKKILNGELIELSPEEEKEWEDAQGKAQKPVPTLDERVTTVENELSEIKTSYQEGVNNA